MKQFLEKNSADPAICFGGIFGTLTLDSIQRGLGVYCIAATAFILTIRGWREWHNRNNKPPEE